MSMRSLTLVAALALVPHSAQGKCAQTEEQPKLLTTRDTKLPDDGGFLVGWETTVYKDSAVHVKGDPSDQAFVAWAGKKQVALKRVSLAPGLSVYRPAAATGSLVVK